MTIGAWNRFSAGSRPRREADKSRDSSLDFEAASVEVEKREQEETRAHCLVTESDLDGWSNAKFNIMLTCRVCFNTLIHPVEVSFKRDADAV